MTLPWKTDRWFTSSWNYLPEVTQGFAFPNEIKIHDMTLRDGEQQAGIELRKEDKVRIAEVLAELGVHRIEAGMPAVSNQDEEAIREIVKRDLGPEIFAFCRCMVSDVERAGDCGVDGIVVEIPTSRHLIENAYQWPLERALEQSVKATSRAQELGLYTSFFTIDATREDMNWLLDFIDDVAAQGHMDSLVLVDTMGVCTPQAIQYFVQRVKERVDKPLEAHFHNDFGLAVANTLVALANGVEVAHTSICGVGERSGAAALEDVVLGLLTLYGIDLGLSYDRLYELAQMTVGLCRHRLPQNKSIVGEALFSVESGIVAMWLDRCTGPLATEVFPLHWELMGHDPPQVVLGKGAGQASIVFWLEKLGLEASEEEIERLLPLVKERAMAQRSLLSEEEFEDLARGILERDSSRG
jgi:isopropylmalate/homocitrate/citramalate synthase